MSCNLESFKKVCRLSVYHFVLHVVFVFPLYLNMGVTRCIMLQKVVLLQHFISSLTIHSTHPTALRIEQRKVSTARTGIFGECKGHIKMKTQEERNFQQI